MASAISEEQRLQDEKEVGKAAKWQRRFCFKEGLDVLKKRTNVHGFRVV